MVDVAESDERGGVSSGGGEGGRGWLPGAGVWKRCLAVALVGAISRVGPSSDESGTWRWWVRMAGSDEHGGVSSGGGAGERTWQTHERSRKDIGLRWGSRRVDDEGAAEA